MVLDDQHSKLLASGEKGRHLLEYFSAGSSLLDHAGHSRSLTLNTTGTVQKSPLIGPLMVYAAGSHG